MVGGYDWVMVELVLFNRIPNITSCPHSAMLVIHTQGIQDISKPYVLECVLAVV